MTSEPTFTPKEVVKITGIPHGTLNSWHARGLLKSFIGAEPGGKAGLARQYSTSQVFGLTVLAWGTQAAFEPRIAAALARTAIGYTPRLDGDNGGPCSLVVAGYAFDDGEAHPDLFITRRYRMADSEFTPDFMPTMRQRHGDCGIFILPLSALQDRFVQALESQA